MLPYQESGEMLEKILERLFEDDGSTLGDVKILGISRSIDIYSNC